MTAASALCNLIVILRPAFNIMGEEFKSCGITRMMMCDFDKIEDKRTTTTTTT